MQPLNLGIELDQGVDFNLVIGIFGDCSPIDITGYSFLGEMKSNTDVDSPIVAEFQFKILNQSTNKGQVQMSLPSLTTLQFNTSTSDALQGNRLTTPFVFDVKMSDYLGNTSRIIQGIVYVSPQATQETFT